MNTVIKINGLDVEFGEKVPTKPGAYWWTFNQTSRVMVRQLWSDDMDRVLFGLWSTSPLVPAVEVERAYLEGYRQGGRDVACSYEAPGLSYSESRAKRVTEGQQ